MHEEPAEAARPKGLPGSAWPRLGLSVAPRPGTGAHLARRVLDHDHRLSDPRRLAEDLGIPVRYNDLAAERGGLEAALLPNVRHRFVIVCDTWVSPHEPERIPFRIAHELAHTFFYDWEHTPPKRVAPASAAQEAFCDEFASALIGLDTAAAS